MLTFDAWVKTLKNNEKLTQLELALMRAAWDRCLLAVLEDHYAQTAQRAAA